MTGKEFYAIRRFNRITQEELVTHIPSLRSRNSIYQIEHSDFVPPRYVKILGQLIGVNLLDEDVAKSFYEAIPDSNKLQPKRIDGQGSRDKYKIIDTNGNEIAKERLFTNNNRKRKVAYSGV